MRYQNSSHCGNSAEVLTDFLLEQLSLEGLFSKEDVEKDSDFNACSLERLDQKEWEVQ